MNARDRMLANIRAALGDQPRPDARCPVSVQAPPVRAGALADEFAESLSTLGGQVFQTPNENATRGKIQQIVGGRSYIGSSAPIIRACGFTTEFSRESCASAEFGISSADFVLADTGSLVFLSESQESRLISLLPPRHIAVIEKDRILGSLDELFARVPYPAAQSSSMVIVTGPSRTADIEMRLVRGVHGPGEVTVIIVNNM